MGLRRAWDDFLVALREGAPVSFATIRPPVSGAVERLEAAFDVDLTDELLTWFLLHGGSEERDSLGGLGGSLLPGGYLLSVEEAIASAAMWRGVQITDPLTADLYADPAPAPEPAGQRANAMLPQYVMISADGGGGGTFVDTRPGSLYGCVRQWGSDAAEAYDELVAGSLSELLVGVTRSIVHGVEIDGWYATMPDGALWWEVADQSDPTPPPEAVTPAVKDAGDELDDPVGRPWHSLGFPDREFGRQWTGQPSSDQ